MFPQLPSLGSSMGAPCPLEYSRSCLVILPGIAAYGGCLSNSKLSGCVHVVLLHSFLAFTPGYCCIIVTSWQTKAALEGLSVKVLSTA